MAMEKPKWHKPALCAVTRNTPEENVLSFCKMQFGQLGGPGWAVGCRFDPACSVLSTS